MFTINDAPKKLIEALKKDPSRVESYTWQSLYRDVYEAGGYWDRRYLTNEKAKITTEHYVTKIAILELTGEDESTLGQRTLNQLYNTTTTGVGGTGSSSYSGYQSISQAQTQAHYNAMQAQARAQYNSAIYGAHP